MAEGLNRCTLIGNVGQDPELRSTTGNQSVLTLRVATTENNYNATTQERKERTEWHTAVIWGNRAVALERLISKGSRLCIEGRIQTRSWEDKQGQKRYSTEINASNVVLLGDNKGRQERQGGGAGGDERGGSDPSVSNQGEGDIPFVTSSVAGHWSHRSPKHTRF